MTYIILLFLQSLKNIIVLREHCTTTAAYCNDNRSLSGKKSKKDGVVMVPVIKSMIHGKTFSS